MTARISLRAADGRAWQSASLLRIGRASASDVHLEDRSASRAHAEIRLDADGWHLRDLGSTNGTYVDGHRAASCILRGGELLRFGEATLLVEEASADLAPPEPLPWFAGLRVLPALRHGAVAVFPLIHESGPASGHRLLAEALAEGTFTVREVSESGSVPDLRVSNEGHSRVLLLEGEELRGAKQNRILNTTVLVPAGATLLVPVSCVERGRWHRTSDTFAAGQTIATPTMRGTLKRSVSDSLTLCGSHRSDQSAVWDDVRTSQEALEVSSATMCFSDTLAVCAPRLEEAAASFPCPEGTCGAAVAIGGRLVAADVFDGASTCAKAWHRLLRGSALEGLNRDEQEPPTEDAVSGLLAEMGAAPWRGTATVGEGKEYRASCASGSASALLHEGTILHASYAGS